MTLKNLTLACFLSGAICSSTLAGDPMFHLVTSCVPDCVGKWCCPDYCPKDEPCFCKSIKYCCDDYCPKQEPCVCAPLRFCCDDYCPKCPPAPCGHTSCESLKCGPPSCPSTLNSTGLTSTGGSKRKPQSADRHKIAVDVRKRSGPKKPRSSPGLGLPWRLVTSPSKRASR